MSGTFTVNVSEVRGFVAVPANLDQLAVVIGVSSLGVGLSPFYLSGQSVVTGVGYGDAVDTLCQIIEQVQNNGTTNKFPAALYTCTGTTAGSYGTIDVTGVTGTSVVTVHAATHPFGTYEAYVRVTLGGTIATGPISLSWSLDGGRTMSPAVSLGTATTFTIPNSNVQFDFAAGTLVTGDVIKVRTKAPAPVAADIDAAFAALAVSSIDFSLVVCDWDMTAALAAHVSTGLSALRAVGKRATALVRTKIRNFETAETEATWSAAIVSDYAAFSDSNICVRAEYGFIKDAMTVRQYLRSDLAQFAADVVRIGRADFPDVPADQPESNFQLVDATGATIGHDEGPRGAVTGLSNDDIGNRFCSGMRLPDFARREDVFSTVPWVMYATDERIRNLPTRRIANAMERVAVASGNSSLGGRLSYIKANPLDPASRNRLTVPSRNAVHAVIFDALNIEFRDDIQNASDGGLDTGLVQVDPVVTVSGGNLLGVNVTLKPSVFGYLLNLGIKLAVQQ